MNEKKITREQLELLATATQRAELAESALENERGNHIAFREANERAVQRAIAAEAALARALVLEESDRQLVLMALAILSLECPGFDDALNRIAVRIDRMLTHGDNPDAPPDACRAWPGPATIGGRPYNE
jgi:hypothetical protein